LGSSAEGGDGRSDDANKIPVEELRAKWQKVFKEYGGGFGEDGEGGALTDDQVAFAEYVEGFLCKVSGQPEAAPPSQQPDQGDANDGGARSAPSVTPAEQRAFSPATLTRYHVTPAIDSPDPAPHNWPTHHRRQPSGDRDDVRRQLEERIVAWKRERKAARAAESKKRFDAFLKEESSPTILDNSAMDMRLRYSDLRGKPKRDFTDFEIWDTVTQHGRTPTADDVIRLQGTTHVQMYTLDAEEVVDYNETVRPVEDEMNLADVFANWSPETSQVIFHFESDRRFSNHDPVLYDLEAIGRLSWPDENATDEELSSDSKFSVGSRRDDPGAAASEVQAKPKKRARKPRKQQRAKQSGGVVDDSSEGDDIAVEDPDEEQVVSFGNFGSGEDDGDDALFGSDDATDNEDVQSYSSTSADRENLLDPGANVPQDLSETQNLEDFFSQYDEDFDN